MWKTLSRVILVSHPGRATSHDLCMACLLPAYLLVCGVVNVPVAVSGDHLVDPQAQQPAFYAPEATSEMRLLHLLPPVVGGLWLSPHRGRGSRARISNADELALALHFPDACVTRGNHGAFRPPIIGRGPGRPGPWTGPYPRFPQVRTSSCPPARTGSTCPRSPCSWHPANPSPCTACRSCPGTG